MRLIIAGTRTFNDVNLMYTRLDYLKKVATEVVSGHARGADKMGEMWAHEHNIPVKLFPADWGAYKKAAGFFRNEQMAAYADYLVAFWDGKSKGTAHMIEQMKSQNKPVVIVKYDDHCT